MELHQGNRLLLCAGLQPFLLQSWQRGEMGGRAKISDPYVRSSELIFPTKEFHLSAKSCVQNWEVLRRRLGPGWGCDHEKAVPTTGTVGKFAGFFFLKIFWRLSGNCEKQLWYFYFIYPVCLFPRECYAWVFCLGTLFQCTEGVCSY